MFTLSLFQKTLLSALLTIAILVSGILFQYSYHQRKIVYEKVITGYYSTYFQREPDPIGLRHWVTWALNKWPLEKVEQVGFIEAREKGSR